MITFREVDRIPEWMIKSRDIKYIQPKERRRLYINTRSAWTEAVINFLFPLKR